MGLIGGQGRLDVVYVEGVYFHDFSAEAPVPVPCRQVPLEDL